MKKYILPITALLLTSCTNLSRTTALYQPDGRLKPQVCIAPVIDLSQDELCDWDMGRELTEEMRRALIFSPKVHPVIPSIDVGQATSLSHLSPKEITEKIGQQAGVDYLVLSEIVEHSLQKDQNHKLVLSTTIRLRVIDTKRTEARVVLQELISQTVPLVGTPSALSKAAWGTKAYENSEIAFAHRKILKKMVDRIEQTTR